MGQQYGVELVLFVYSLSTYFYLVIKRGQYFPFKVAINGKQDDTGEEKIGDNHELKAFFVLKAGMKILKGERKFGKRSLSLFWKEVRAEHLGSLCAYMYV